MISTFSLIFSTGYFDLSMKDYLSLCEWVLYLHVCMCTGPERPKRVLGLLGLELGMFVSVWVLGMEPGSPTRKSSHN